MIRISVIIIVYNTFHWLHNLSKICIVSNIEVVLQKVSHFESFESYSIPSG